MRWIVRFFFKTSFEAFHKRIEEINTKDMSEDRKLLKRIKYQWSFRVYWKCYKTTSCWIKRVCNQKDLRGICDILVKEYETITKIYDVLIDVLKGCETTVIEHFENTHKKYSKELFNIYNSLESIMEKIAHETYKNIKKKKKKKTCF